MGKKITALCLIMLSAFAISRAQIVNELQREKSDSIILISYLPSPEQCKFIHRIGIEARPAYIIRESKHPALYNVWNPEGSVFSAHLKYSFQIDHNTIAGRTYSGSYQGVGVGLFKFANSKSLGSPIALYLFQGAHIARISPRWALDYEWNFGISAPWKPYDEFAEQTNWVIGSKVNAYINIDIYLNYIVSRRLSVAAGLSVTHFSNGNTQFPNAGLNIAGAKFGLTYNLNDIKQGVLLKRSYRNGIQEFPRHVSYDLVLFGSWRKRGMVIGEDIYILPKSYPVLGASFAPMYNFGHNFRAGAALDAIYDSSANMTFDHNRAEQGEEYRSLFREPPFSKQIALGVSGRVEFVMPYFTIGFGVGTNLLHNGGDMKSVYQILALKIETTRNSFIHIGYSLHDFKDPNFLMLGIGFRFNNQSPLPYHCR